MGYRLAEGLERFQKKGKSSEFNPQDYEKVKSSPALTVWSHESVKDCQKKLDFGAKTQIFLKIQKIPRTKTEVFSDSNGQNLFRTVDETSKIQKNSQDQNRSIFRLRRTKSLQNS